MKITVSSSLVFSLLLTTVAWAGTPSIQGTVKDASGTPVKDADVKIEAKNGNVVTVKTDANGHYKAGPLAVGTYKVALLMNGVVKASIVNTTVAADKPTELAFNLKGVQGASKRHMVYVAPDTGTHLGGGRWVTVDENGNVVNDNPNLEKVSAMRQQGSRQAGGGR